MRRAYTYIYEITHQECEFFLLFRSYPARLDVCVNIPVFQNCTDVEIRWVFPRSSCPMKA